MDLVVIATKVKHLRRKERSATRVLCTWPAFTGFDLRNTFVDAHILSLQKVLVTATCEKSCFVLFFLKKKKKKHKKKKKNK